MFQKMSVICILLGAAFCGSMVAAGVIKEIDCGPVGELMNGYFEIPVGTTFGNVVHAVCNEGYNLIGSVTRECQANGKWSDAEPYCEVVKCEDPPEIPDGEIVNPREETVTFSSVVIYKCKKGHLIGHRTIYCTAHGNYSNPPPQCKEIHCPLVPVENGRISAGFGSSGYRSVVTFACNDGYMLEGSDTIMCQENGQWSSKPPTCSKMSICRLPNIENGWVTNINPPYTYDDSIEFACKLGYILKGKKRVSCIKYDTWYPSPPKCEEDPCQTDGFFNKIKCFFN
ncbi:complement component receptor 1-like protein isoform X1 [Erpetoichthys calabaricus]|uniref:complement component receptor 1-like protein isoform X1 n=1 Tax=Erpetoichthys calabaricus TaxID=27687 RepID=UPI0022343749|nr:complement component receptor 1-like protein isoform X1 [Erpetoichthys calabaricus]